MKRILYLVQKEFRQIRRDPPMLGVIFIMPVIQIVLLGYAVTTDILHTRIVIVDRDNSQYSREYTARFDHTVYFDVVEQDPEITTLTDYLDRGLAGIVMVIPRDFQRDIVRGSSPKVQLLVDALDGNSAGIAIGYLAQMAGQAQLEVVRTEPALARKLASAHVVSVEPRMWYNPNLESRFYMVPGIVALLLTMVSLFLASMGIVREKEVGTLEQLMVTPIHPLEMMIGKTIPFAILGLIEVSVGILAAWVIFGIGLEGSFFLLLGFSLVYLFTTLSFGILISTVSHTQQQAMFTAWFFSVFMILLSGFFVPIANMPDGIQYLTYANPLRYFITIVREIYMKGSGIQHLWKEGLALAAYGLVMIVLASSRFRKRVG